MAVSVINPIVYNPNVKDSRWLTLDVCREYTRNKCSRSEDECRFAHPPPNVEVQNGRVMCCFDSIKGKCQRHDPPCKYLHPPQHLKEQLLQNGRHNLILKHLHMQMLMNGVHSVYPVVYDMNGSKSFTASYAVAPIPGQETFMTPHYVVPNGTTFNPYYGPTATYGAIPGGLIPTTLNACGATVPISHQPATGDNNPLVPACLPSPAMEPQHTDHVEVVEQDNGCSNNNAGPISANTSSFLPCQNVVSHCQPPVWQQSTSPSPSVYAVDSAAPANGYCQPVFYQGANMEHGVTSYVKRGAIVGSKYSIPMYQAPPPHPLAYQQMALAAMHLQQQQQPMYVPITIAGHPSPISPRY